DAPLDLHSFPPRRSSDLSLLDDAVEELRSADGAGRAEAGVRLDVDVDAYLPADYIPFEAAKIDVHRRVAGAGEAAELRALRDERSEEHTSELQSLRQLVC